MMDAGDNQAKVLVMDANPTRARELKRRLSFLNYDPILVSAADEASGAGESAAHVGVAVVLGDLTRQSLRNRFREVIACQPNLPILMVDPGKAVEVAPDELRGHPQWSLDIPIRRQQLVQLLRRAERYDGDERRQQISGNCPPIRMVRTQIEQVASFDTNVLVTGESGTGKELVANTIHALSERANKPFVPINCGAIPAELLESELFGHEKGAFTGAVSARVGRFELAEGGTLFLDEIGDMSLDMQVKLLRVLQERSFERVGSNNTRHCDVRIIAATHRNLPEAVKNSEFREDLFYRLNVFPIEMPPLYKRASDLPQLLDELLLQHQGDDAGNLRFSQDALQVLAAYSWPGNIRELSNLVERLAILCPTGEIGLEDLPAKYRDTSNRRPSDTERDPQQNCLPSNGAAVTLTGISLKLHMQQIETDLIIKAMAEADGVVAAAARMLKMQRTTLVEKLAKYQIA